jgi:hypothetical protein
MLLTVVFVKKGGRLGILEVTPTIEQQFLKVISEHTAGCPQQGIHWTNLKQPSKTIRGKGGLPPRPRLHDSTPPTTLKTQPGNASPNNA